MKKVLAILLMLVVLVQGVAFAEEIKDMPDNWAKPYLEAAVENGLLTGSDGFIRPDDPMTRAEMATIMVRATGAKQEADISKFTDVSKDSWYHSAMAKAVYMKAFTGSGNLLEPEKYITRQEAFVVLSRVFGLTAVADKSSDYINDFSDKNDIASWAAEGVSMIIKSGYVGGSDGKINPLSNITRAEFAAVMGRLVKYYIDEPGEYTPSSDGNIMVRSSNVTIKGLKTDKAVFVGDLTKEEKVDIIESEITGPLVVRGGYVTAGEKLSDVRACGSDAIFDSKFVPKEFIKNMSVYVTNDAKYVFEYSKYTE